MEGKVLKVSVCTWRRVLKASREHNLCFHHGVPEGDLHHVTLTGTLDSKEMITVAPISWLVPSSTSLLRLHLPLLRGHILLLLLCQHFDLLNDVFRQQLVHSLIPTTSPLEGCACLHCLPAEEGSLLAGWATCCLQHLPRPHHAGRSHGPTTLAGLTAPEPGMLGLTPKKTQGLHEQQTKGRMILTKVLNSACLSEHHLGLACCQQSCSE